MKIRIEFDTINEAVAHRDEVGGTVAILEESGNIFHYSLDYYNEDIEVDQNERVVYVPVPEKGRVEI